jgi:exo-beta-1,3-glucanase (GH17 family)
VNEGAAAFYAGSPPFCRPIGGRLAETHAARLAALERGGAAQCVARALRHRAQIRDTWSRELGAVIARGAVMRAASIASFTLSLLTVGCSSLTQNKQDGGPPGSDGGADYDLAGGNDDLAGGNDDLAGGNYDLAGGNYDLAGVNNGLRAIPPDVLARKAICYSGYRAGQSPENATYPSEAQIKEDLQLLIRGGWTFLRLFDCSPNFANVLKVIKDNNFDIKVLSGVNLAGPMAAHDAENQAEIARCVPFYTSNPDIVVAVSVGNEMLDDWSNIKTPATDLAAYITQVRGQITQPVTTNDMAPPFMFGMDGSTNYADVVKVVAAVDFLNIHIYPFLDAPYGAWDWQQQATPAGHGRAVAMMNAAMTYAMSMLDGVRTAVTNKGFNLPILIGETGWKSMPAPGDMTEPFLAHPVNEKMYYEAIMSWIYGANKTANSPLAVFYFEGFDEPWKTTDDGWGLFDVNRNSKYVIWTQFPDKKPANAPNYTDNDAVYYK